MQVPIQDNYFMTEKSTSFHQSISIAVSISVHVILILLLSGPVLTKMGEKDRNEKITVVEFEEPEHETNIIVDKGIKSDEIGLNRGVQNQTALDESRRNLPKGENYNETGITEKQLNAVQQQIASPESAEQLPNQATKNVESVKSNGDETSELRKSTKKVFSTTSSIFRPRNETGVKNLETSSGKYGSFTLSSYEWEYAPYMLAWIEKIKNSWVEPISYLAGKGKGGQVIVKTTLYKTGRKKKIELIFTNVNDEMTNEALKAVEKSFNLPALPESFKENELEVTFSMIYPAY